jgi:Pectate lyase superfamily protein
MSRKIILLAAIAAVVLATAVPALAGSWSPNNSGKGTFANHKDFPGLVDIGEDRKMYLAKAHSGLMAGTEYTSSVRATDAPGNPDATPATSTFTPLEIITNVRDFGATGNGTRNDTAAFERAMAEAARVGGVVYVPAPGNYRIASVTPPDNTHLQVEAGAVLKKYGTKSGPLFNIEGPNDTTFRTNVHIEGVGGSFTMDLNDAGQKTAGIRYRNVRNFSLRNMVCIQNNDNPSQEAPSSRRPCLAFLPTTMTPIKGVYNHPIDGEISNVHSKQSPYGWGLVQTTGGANLSFTNISSEGGVPLRLENYSNGWTPMKNITADGVTCRNGHDAVHWNPHGAIHPGPLTVKNVTADSCESAISIAGGGSYGPNSSVDGVTVIPGNQAQDRDSDPTGYSGAWDIAPSKWCVDNRATSYTINLSNVDCGGLANHRP